MAEVDHPGSDISFVIEVDHTTAGSPNTIAHLGSDIGFVIVLVYEPELTSVTDLEADVEITMTTIAQMAIVVTPVEPPVSLGPVAVFAKGIIPEFAFEFDRFGRPI